VKVRQRIAGLSAGISKSSLTLPGTLEQVGNFFFGHFSRLPIAVDLVLLHEPHLKSRRIRY
tara:strand:- start:183 stop:365 length:183 start_codon:yes stop_codon:yes gene_type:complete